MSATKSQVTLEQAIRDEVNSTAGGYVATMAAMDPKDRSNVMDYVRKHRKGELGLKSWRALARAVVRTYGLKVNANHFANYLKELK